VAPFVVHGDVVVSNWKQETLTTLKTLQILVSFGATVCKAVRAMLSDRCLSCLSVCPVCDVGVLWPNG